MKLERFENENEEQFLWRIGQEKTNGTLDMNWTEIADVMNKEFRDDVSEYRSEAAYRKPFQQALRFWEAGVFKDYSQSDYIKDLQEQKHEIRKEKQKLFDERTAINKKLRDNARVEENLSYLERLIKQNGQSTFVNIENGVQPSDNDLFIALSDFHLGADNENYFGSYNSDIAKRRLEKYLTKISEIQQLHKSENAYVCLLGDIINGEIRHTVQLQNRENLIEQVQKASELISAFLYELSTMFANVYVNSVSGNHSRTSMNKDEVLRNNRLDTLIPWYTKAKLSHIKNISFCEDNIDPTISNWEIRSKKYLMVHGDYDSFSESGISKLVLLLGYKPEGIFYGHLHRCSYDSIADVKIIRSGSFCGAIDDYTITKRFSGVPSQMVCVLNSDGVKACYPIELT